MPEDKKRKQGAGIKIKIGEKPKVDGCIKLTTTHITSSCCLVLYLCQLSSSTSRTDQRRKNRIDVTRAQRRKDGKTTSYNHEEGRGGRTKNKWKRSNVQNGEKDGKRNREHQKQTRKGQKRARRKRTYRKGIEHQKWIRDEDMEAIKIWRQL